MSDYQTIDVSTSHQEQVCQLLLNRPKARNAMSLAMVDEILSACEQAQQQGQRVLVMRGSEANFCAGGDIKDMQNAYGDKAKLQRFNRAYGEMLVRLEQLPMIVICVLEGAVLGGGFGLACISDLAIAADNCQLGMPETNLGIIPAQIAPFVVKRIGLTQARRFALFGQRVDNQQAKTLGLVHEAVTASELDACLEHNLKLALRCAPKASANTKQIILNSFAGDLDAVLDQAANDFAEAVLSPEGQEGTQAFIEKRKPNWA